MRDIFISHVEEDLEAALAIAQGLEAAGYTTWHYTRDSLPGPSYLEQINTAIAQAHAVVLIISQHALDSPHQVTSEIDRAHEGHKPFLPVLRGITHDVMQRSLPRWSMALGTSVSIRIPPEGATTIVPRLIEGLNALGIPPSVSKGMRYACLIGTNQYQEAAAFPSIPWPEANVNALAERLKDKRLGDFDEIICLTSKAHTDTIREIKNLSGQLGPDDLLLIYYAGYGLIDEEETGKLYLAAENTLPDELPSSAIGLERIQTYLARCPARQTILLLDCQYRHDCTAVSEQVALNQLGTYTISNCPEPESWGVPLTEGPYSPLTTYLLQGLATGQADLYKEGQVTIEQWFTYAQQQLADRGLLKPLKWDKGAAGHWVVAHAKGRTDSSQEMLPPRLHRILKDIIRMFDHGLVIPFLGFGALPEELQAVSNEHMPSIIPPLERRLVSKLAETARELTDDRPERMQEYPLTILAQYCQTLMLGGRLDFYHELKQCFPKQVTPGPIHNLLVQQRKPLLVVTTCYDTALEQVFSQHGKPYAVVTHIAYAADPENLGKVVVQYSDRPDEPEMCLSDELSIDLDRWWVFYKIQGTFDLYIQGLRGREEIDSIIISEEDYFSFLGRLSDQHRTIPTVFNRTFQNGLFLFLGYWLTDWNFRTIVHILRPERKTRRIAGYAVRHNATDIEKQFWESKNVELIDLWVEDFMCHLAERLSIGA